MILTSLDNISQVQETVLGAAHSESVSIFGEEGYRNFAQRHRLEDFNPIYGNYAIISKTPDATRISTDHFGLFRLYVYRSDEAFAVSDSILELVEFARTNRLPVTPYAPAAHAFLIGKGVGQQLSSFRTPVAEIELVPHWCDVVLCTGKLELERKPDVKWTQDLREANWQAGRFFASLLRSYVEAGMRPFIRMSAGLDSRCTLAAMLCISDHDCLKYVGLQTSRQENRAHERRIVMDMIEYTPFEEIDRIPSIGRTDWSDWKRAHLGSRSHFAKQLTYGPPFPGFTGACGELAREFYDWDGTVSGIRMPNVIPEDIREQVSDDIAAAVARFDGQCKDLLTVENKHYQMFRNRFHFGSALSETIFGFPPLVYALLSNDTGRGANEPLHRLIFELGGKEVLEHEFDEEEKGFAGPIPMDWRQVRFSESDLIEREIYLDGLMAGSQFSEAERANRVARPVPRLVSDQFLGECSALLAEVKYQGLLSDHLVSVAQKQLATLRDKRDRAIPAIFPALFAALSLGVPAMDRRIDSRADTSG